MPRIAKEQMKKDEEKVIRLLLTRANESIDSIAKKCGFSRQKVWRIIKRLEKNKTIWGYHAVVDKEKLNLKSYIMLIKAAIKPVKNIDDHITECRTEKVASKLGIMVEYSCFIHGPYDWIIIFNARDIKHAKKFAHAISKKNSEYIVDTILSEELFPTRKCGFLNPNIEKLREFVLCD